MPCAPSCASSWRRSPTLPDELHRAWTTLAAERAGMGRAEADRPGRHVRGAWLRPRVALVVGVDRRSPAPDREHARDGAGSPARDRGAGRPTVCCVLLAFAIGSIGAFLLFDWPPLLKHVVLGYLLVFLIVRLVLVLGRFLLAPGAERFRLVPMATATARFWFVWSAVLVGWFFFVKFTLSELAMLGVSRPAGLPGRARLRRRPGRARALRGLAASGAAKPVSGRAARIGSAPGCSRSTWWSSGCCCSPARRRRFTSASSSCCCRSRSGASILRSSMCGARRAALPPTTPSRR